MYYLFRSVIELLSYLITSRTVFIWVVFFFDSTFIKAQDSENKEGLRVKKQEVSLREAAVR